MLFIFLAACSDYNLVGQEDKPAASADIVTEPAEEWTDVYTTETAITDTATTETATDTVTEPDTETDTEPTPSEDPCVTTQVISTGLWDDTDGDGDRELVYAEVYAKPVFSHLGDSAIEVAQGEVSPFDLVIVNQCAPMRVWNLFYIVDDDDLNGTGWLYDISDERVISGELAEYSTGTEFTPIETHNLDWGGDADELHHEWCAEEEGSAMCVDMGSPREFALDQSDVYSYEFTQTGYAPVGTVYQQMIVSVIWEDVTTGKFIHQSLYDIVDVTVVE